MCMCQSSMCNRWRWQLRDGIRVMIARSIGRTMTAWEPSSESSELSTRTARAFMWPMAALDDADAKSSPCWLGFLNFDAALIKPAQSNLLQVRLVLIEFRYPFVAAPHFAWLNSVAFVSFPVCWSTTFRMTHDLPPWPSTSFKVTWPSFVFAVFVT